MERTNFLSTRLEKAYEGVTLTAGAGSRVMARSTDPDVGKGASDGRDLAWEAWVNLDSGRFCSFLCL
jgi:hypothetical protein